MFLRLVCAVTLIFGPGLLAADPPSSAKIDEQSQQIIRKVTDRISAAKTAEVEVRLTVKALQNELPGNGLDSSYSLSIERPNKLALILKEGTLGASVISDGTNAITYIPALKIYTTDPAPKDLIGVGYQDGAGAADLGSMAFISALFNARPYEALLAGVTEAAFAGREKIADVEYDRINLKQEGLDWSFFASIGEQPQVRRIDVAIPEMKMTIDFIGWKLNAMIPENRFKFTPPEGVKKVDSLDEEKEGEGNDSDMVDEELPAFKLNALDGSSFDTASLRGKTSLLVIWTGEAEHCLNALRATSELVAENKELAFHSINLDETPDKARIKSLLAKHKLPSNPALDPEHKSVDELEVEGVPITFLVDKAGIVRKAFLGYHPDFRTLVGKEIEALTKPAAAKPK